MVYSKCHVLILLWKNIIHDEGFGQWRSKALVGPSSTATWGPSVASAPRAEAGSPVLREGMGLLPGLGSDVRLSSKLPQPPRVLVFLCSEMTSPAIENPVCTVQVSFHTFVIFCGPRSSGPTGSFNRPNPRFLRHWVCGDKPPPQHPCKLRLCCPRKRPAFSGLNVVFCCRIHDSQRRFRL